MKNRDLGLDIGVNSIGWALIEWQENNPEKVVACGVRVFQEATEADQKTLKNKNRREMRGARRQTYRRKMRRQTIRNLLVRHQLLPEKSEEFDLLMQLDPYELRTRALDTQLTPYELGRVIYHLNQRRGFKSNRKIEKLKKKEEGPVLKEISQLKEKLSSSDKRTLGEFLISQEKRRSIHTERTMYREELERIWESQAKFHPILFSDANKNQIRDTLFFQRDLKIQKFLIGNCTFELHRKRASWAWMEAQRFRILQNLNNLTVKNPITREYRRLYEEERSVLFKLLEKQEKLDWKRARRELGLHDGELFNLEEGGKKHLQGNSTSIKLRKIFGTRWDKFRLQEKNELVADILTITSDNGFRRRMRENWKFDDLTAEKLSEVELDDGYCSLSLKAIRKLLPFLEAGMRYDEACEAVGYKHYAPRTQEMNLAFLDEPPKLRNPIVEKALWQTRKVVNSIIRTYGKPERIHVELARDLKNSAIRREEISKNNRKREEKNKQVEEILKKEFGIQSPSRDDIVKYKLWEECKMKCPYTGTTISREMIFSPDVDVEHILPYSLTLDDSFMNKTLCMAKENREVKKNRSPYEAYSGNPQKYTEILQRVKDSQMPDNKRLRFERKEIDLDKYVSRQLNDTRYICREAVKYIGRLGVKVQVTKGMATAGLRFKWGLNSILSPDSDLEKNRADHRHHTIDAIVIALTNHRLLQTFSRLSATEWRGKGLYDHGVHLPEPWKNFRFEVKDAVDKIIVSHASTRKIAGALHEETVYGFVGITEKNRILLTCRVPLLSLTPNMVENIRDPYIRELVGNRMAQFGNKAKDAFAEPLYHKNNSRVPIHSVRILKDVHPDSYFGLSSTGGKKDKFFLYGSNHHVEIVEDKKTGKWKGIFVTTMEAARRARITKKPIVQRDHGEDCKFIMSLMINDMVEIEQDGKKLYYRVQLMSGPNNIIVFRLHVASTLDDKKERLMVTPNSLKKYGIRKINVDPIGRLEPAND